MNQIEVLAYYGDPIEKDAVKLGILNRFSKYAEFWNSFVFPYRKLDKPSKLNDNYPENVKKIANSHYSIIYHLRFVKVQSEFLAQSDSPIHYSDPFFHLAASIDLVIRTLFLVFLESEIIHLDELSQEELVQEIDKIIKIQGNKQSSTYSKDFARFKRNYYPIGFTLHSIEKYVDTYLENIPDYRNFKNLADDKIRPYRNQLIHNVPPISEVDDKTILIPTPDKLSNYKDGLWPDNPNLEDFESAYKILSNLIDTNLTYINNIWDLLLSQMKIITNRPAYKDYFQREMSVEKFLTSQPQNLTYPTTPSGINNSTKNSMGSAEYRPTPSDIKPTDYSESDPF